MIPSKVHGVIFCALLLMVVAMGPTQLALAQDSNQTQRATADTRREDETNLDAQLYLILATINYESIGLRTDISMREGAPVVAGTLNMGTVR